MRWLVLLLPLLHPPAEPVWVDPAGRPTQVAMQAIQALELSAEDGLDPASYDSAALRAAATRLRAVPAPPDALAFDTALHAAMRRYLHDLHVGRVDPRAAGFRLPPHAVEEFDAKLRQAARGGTLPLLIAGMRPAIPLYRELREVLRRYRILAADPSLVLTGPQPEVDEAALRRFLAAVGDLPAEETLATGVARFQVRHGLEADGVIGRATRAQLLVPLTQRVRQIELSMERLRWLPDRDTERLIGVNIPMFRLWAVEGQESVFTTEVIVGRALRTRTPVLVDRLEQIVFRPYWNVPPSILRREILPALGRDPDYLRKHGMEFVGDGTARRLRQRPGPSNALGLIKFSFPNDEAIYMHGTPAPSLFGHARRDFSHGCIRVADPVGLAAWVLEPEGWSRERVVAATQTEPGSTVTLAQPVRVALFYLTAFAVPGEGVVYFADDLYGHDERLHRARAQAR